MVEIRWRMAGGELGEDGCGAGALWLPRLWRPHQMKNSAAVKPARRRTAAVCRICYWPAVEKRDSGRGGFAVGAREQNNRKNSAGGGDRGKSAQPRLWGGARLVWRARWRLRSARSGEDCWRSACSGCAGGGTVDGRPVLGESGGEEALPVESDSRSEWRNCQRVDLRWERRWRRWCLAPRLGGGKMPGRGLLHGEAEVEGRRSGSGLRGDGVEVCWLRVVDAEAWRRRSAEAAVEKWSQRPEGKLLDLWRHGVAVEDLVVL